MLTYVGVFLGVFAFLMASSLQPLLIPFVMGSCSLGIIRSINNGNPATMLFLCLLVVCLYAGATDPESKDCEVRERLIGLCIAWIIGLGWLLCCSQENGNKDELLYLAFSVVGAAI